MVCYFIGVDIINEKYILLTCEIFFNTQEEILYLHMTM